MGQKYVAYNLDGQVTNFYDSSIEAIPTEITALAVSDAQWKLCILQPGWLVVGGVLVAPNNFTNAQVLSQAQQIQISNLKLQCQVSIFKGFQSSALLAVYTYPAKLYDQQNLNASITSSLIPSMPTTWTTSFWCADINGVWDFRQHTAAQIQQVGIDAKNSIMANMAKCQNLAAQVMVATTIDTIFSIVW